MVANFQNRVSRYAMLYGESITNSVYMICNNCHDVAQILLKFLILNFKDQQTIS